MIVSEVLAHFGVTTDGEEAVKKLASAMDMGSSRAQALVGVMGQLAGVLVAGAATAAFVHHQAGIADSLGDTADQLGISASALQQWGFAAQLSGSSAEEMTSAIERLQRSLGDASQGGKTQAAAIRQLGVNYRDASGAARPMQDVLLDIAEGIAGVDDPVRRAAIATDLFGRQGARLLPLLSRGRAGVEELAAEFQALGGGAGPEAIAAASAYNDNIDRLDVAFSSISQRISTFFLPTFIRITDSMVNASRSFFSFADRTSVLQDAIIVLMTALGVIGVAAAVKLIVAFAPMILTALLVAAGVAAVVAVVDDVLTLFRGGKSVIGAFLDEWLGVGTAAKVVATATDGMHSAWVRVQNAISMALEAARGYMRIFSAITGTADDALNGRGLTERLQRALEENVREHQDAEAERNVRELAERINQRVRASQREQEGAAQFGMAFRTDTGASAPVVSEPRTVPVTSGTRGMGDTNVRTGDMHLNISVPPGTSPEMVDRIRRVTAEALEEHTQRALSGLKRQAVEV